MNTDNKSVRRNKAYENEQFMSKYYLPFSFLFSEIITSTPEHKVKCIHMIALWADFNLLTLLFYFFFRNTGRSIYDLK